MTLVAVVPVMALFNVFGQRPDTTTRRHAGRLAEDLRAVAAPRRAATSRRASTITAHQDVKDADARARPRLGRGDDDQHDRAEPARRGEPRRQARRFDLGHIPAGQDYILFMQFQVNPTNVGRRSQDVDLLRRRHAGSLHIDRDVDDLSLDGPRPPRNRRLRLHLPAHARDRPARAATLEPFDLILLDHARRPRPAGPDAERLLRHRARCSRSARSPCCSDRLVSS